MERKARGERLFDEGDGEAIVALAADGLEGGGGDAGFGGEDLEEATGALYGGVVAVGVDDCALTYDVVHDDEAAGMGELERPLKVGGVVLFVGVYEYEIEGGAPFGGELGQGVKGASEPDLYNVVESGAGDVGAGDFSMFGFGFEGDQRSVGRKGAGEPDGAVAAECADFENGAGADGLSEDVEEFSEIGCDLYRGQVGFGRGLEGSVERGVRGFE